MRKAIEQTDFKSYYDNRTYAEVVATIPEYEIATDVDRAGTKAAAVSAMCVYCGCAPSFDSTKYVDLNRPFVYAVVDREWASSVQRRCK